VYFNRAHSVSDFALQKQMIKRQLQSKLTSNLGILQIFKNEINYRANNQKHFSEIYNQT